ncbi:MAG: ABC transporter substrate-binding protein, partial [Bacillota bacterium]
MIRVGWRATVCVWMASILMAMGGGVYAKTTGETLTYATAERIVTLDPQMSLDIAVFNIALHVFDPLVVRTETGGIQPGLAESWEIVDSCTWKFKLRKGIRFHDGSPFTSESVKYTL